MTSGPSRRRALKQAAALGALPALASLPAFAQAFPSKPIRLVVPYPPGGSTDILARAFAEPFAHELGQPVIIENRPGAATNIGLEIAARSPADGYTIYFGTSGLASNPHFGPVPPVDVFKDITPISLVASMPFLVAAHPSLPANSPRELIELAKASPGKLMISSASLETQVKTINKRAGIQLLHVPYKGGAQATNDAIAGHVNLVVALLPVLLPQIRAGKLKPIAISAPRRSPAAPEIPTFQEIGVDGPTPSWFALFVPAGTPAQAIGRLNGAAVAAAADKPLVERTLQQGIEVRSSTPGQLADLLKRDYETNSVLVKELG
ncbi:Bug family tripartite tricarboxylate transporter substrate binding protein [Zeimonas arvi]|uniref:Tripartite tricarboxylate transporter substrate binding protein n=1 Tax=Zeimonas arvi TaxID=2498847 RepID=A0A5C8P415_9BURK|nr:tripartite tricarboxylate transporter substrate binding protein [Zeimonas arvi]TXL68209.1 tripartite tricarboxylate transporter substrate binding protein [Zeimonas arvi]